MPGLITHYICADVCLNRLQNEAAKTVLQKNRPMYNVGAQGPDVFFYYLPSLYKKKIYRMGNVIHKTKINAFFASVIRLADNIEDVRDKQTVLSYLSGYLTHYALDANTHPYIYYKSGFKTTGDRTSAIRHSVNHRQFETNIDVLMLQLISSEKPSDKKIWQFVAASFAEAKPTAEILCGALQAVYGFRLSARQVYAAFRSMRMLNRVLQSKGGKRKQVMAFIENFTIHDHVVSSLIHSQSIDGGLDFLNLKKQPWHFPWENSVTHISTFTEMFETSIEEAVKLVECLFAYNAGELSHDALLKTIGNRSMSTGMDADLPLDFKFSDAVF